MQDIFKDILDNFIKAQVKATELEREYMAEIESRRDFDEASDTYGECDACGKKATLHSIDFDGYGNNIGDGAFCYDCTN